MIRTSAQRTIEAPAERVYRCLADYRTHHPAILPPAFSGFTVEEGGVGAGTIIHFTLKAGGKTQSFRQRVSEPDPGRVLTETTIGTQNTTTFRVEPEGDRARVRIQTEFEGESGIRGFFERLFAPLILRRIYADELRRLDRYLAEQAV
jgi:carbon monoxide dehydrogenase subunit G